MTPYSRGRGNSYRSPDSDTWKIFAGLGAIVLFLVVAGIWIFSRNSDTTIQTEGGLVRLYGPKQSIGTPYMDRRAAFHSQLKRGPFENQEYDPDWEQELAEEIPNAKIVTFPSGSLTLKAALHVPRDNGMRMPAIVYFHGGFSFDASDMEVCEPFMEAGLVVMTPILRSENGGPGDYELFLGEVDDAANAVRWLSQQPYVDPDRIYAFGHSVGGGVAAMLSLISDVPLRHSGGSGGLYVREILECWGDDGMVPFNPHDARECEMRIMMGNVRWMQRPHYGFIGTDDTGVDFSVPILETEAKNEGKSDMLVIRRVPGDHFTSFTPALEAYLRQIQSER